MATAFRAELGFGRAGATVGVIAVYDAPASLDADGRVDPVHSCGHGPQSAGVIGAALALAAVRDEAAGRVVVVGCPADEIHSPLTRERGSGKALTAAAGVWDDVDVVLYPHPEFIDTVWPASLFMRRETARVVGARTLRRDVVCTPLLALANVTTLAAAVDPARLIIESVAVDGDVEEGAGMTFEASLLLFAPSEAELDALADEVHEIIGEAAWSSSAAISAVRPDAGVTALVADAFAAAGRDFVADPPALGFATDFGNVTQVARAALVGVGRAEGWRYHTPTGAAEFAGPAGTENALAIAEVIGLSALRIGAADGL
jgi:metal-dependent amidase/aminoacylase/carboxypeptidase family protein